MTTQRQLPPQAPGKILRKNSSRSFSQAHTNAALAGTRGSIGDQSHNVSHLHNERQRKQEFDLNLAKEVAAIESIISQKKGNIVKQKLGTTGGSNNTIYNPEAFSDGPSFRE